jgi:hypothetical protein
LFELSRRQRGSITKRSFRIERLSGHTSLSITRTARSVLRSVLSHFWIARCDVRNVYSAPSQPVGPTGNTRSDNFRTWPSRPTR